MNIYIYLKYCKALLIFKLITVLKLRNIQVLLIHKLISA